VSGLRLNTRFTFALFHRQSPEPSLTVLSNTYTNKTWAELTGLPVSEITKMEAEFLKGLNYDLAVHHSQYLQWRSLLDGFIFSRDAIRTRASQPQVFGSPQSIIYTPNTAIVPSQPSDLTSLNMYRARSASPPCHSPPRAHRSHYPYLSPENPKKRTAVDAFAEPTTSSTGVYESMRRPARKATFVEPVVPTYPSIPVPVPTHSQPQLVSYPSTSSLTRSTSLNRQIARLPGEGVHGRRGSAGNIYSVEPEMDLRHAATTHAAQMHEYMTGGTSVGGQEYEGYSSLVAPYDRSSQLQMVPPEVSFQNDLGPFDSYADFAAPCILHTRGRASSGTGRCASQGDSALPGPFASVRLPRSHCRADLPRVRNQDHAHSRSHLLVRLRL
jgi:hypothetical protein